MAMTIVQEKTSCQNSPIVQKSTEFGGELALPNPQSEGVWSVTAVRPLETGSHRAGSNG